MLSSNWFSPARLAPVFAVLLAGCIGGGSEPEVVAANQQAAAEQVDIRRYLGPDYCPELRVRESTEVMRRYERGHDNDQAFVIWQASIGNTARECLYDLEGKLTLRVGVSGRVVSGPKGGPGTVSLPLRIAVVKYQEAVLTSELYPLEVAIPPTGSAVFTEVKEIILPSPGSDRDYILYVGFDEKGEVLIGSSAKPGGN